MITERVDTLANGKRTHQVARLVSNLLHPWLVLAVIIALTAYSAAGHNGEWVKWTLLALFLAYLPSIIYAGIRTALLRRAEGNDNSNLLLLRERPRDLLVTALLFGFPAVSALYILGAPQEILTVVIAAAATMLIIALVNLKYRASFHIALLTWALFSLWSLAGAVSLVTILLVPLLGLSRYRLSEHTANQLIIGFALGLAITPAVFHVFRITGV